MKIQFTIDGPLMGYKQTTSKSIFHPKERERSKRYGAWKEKVRILAVQAGIPLTGHAAMMKTIPRLSVHAFWQTSPKVDWKNVYGGIEDGLFWLPQGDRLVRPGKYSDVTTNSEREEAIVTVEF
jgi:hypothetical protein